MTTANLDELLQRGVTAVQMGHAEVAKECFLAILAVDEQHEAAWFWLGQVVEDIEEQRICLENVLTINPDHPRSSQITGPVGRNGRFSQPAVRHRPALSLAGSLLYPERLIEIDDRPPPEKHKAPVIHYTDSSRFDDVWTGESDLCAYCAQELTKGLPIRKNVPAASAN
jgi:hypothetical protein